MQETLHEHDVVFTVTHDVRDAVDIPDDFYGSVQGRNFDGRGKGRRSSCNEEYCSGDASVT